MAPAVVVRVSVRNNGLNHRGREAIDQLWGSSARLSLKIKIKMANIKHASKARQSSCLLGSYPDASHELVIKLTIGRRQVRNRRMDQQVLRAGDEEAQEAEDRAGVLFIQP